jgi:hypothetical protein
MSKEFSFNGVVTHAAKVKVVGCATWEEAVAQAEAGNFAIVENYDKFPEFEWDGDEGAVEEA